MQAVSSGLDNVQPMQSTSRPTGHWFDGRSLARLTDPITWQRGMALYVSQHVLSLDIVPSGAGWILLGEVLGSKRDTYEVSIELALTSQGQVAQWDSLCECPVGVQCKHGVALMLKAAQQGLRLLKNLPDAPAPVPARSAEQLEADRHAALALEQEAARLVAQAHLLNWLRELDRVSASASGAAPREVHEPKHGPTSDRADCFLFLLSIAQGTGTKPQLLLEAAVCKRKANGDWAKPRLMRYAPSPGQAVYDNALAEDLEVMQLIAAMPKARHQSYSYTSGISCRPVGRAGQLALEQAASTGRLFVKDDQDRPGAAVRWGPVRTLQWAWHEISTVRSEGSGWVLRGKVADSHARICHNEPLLYLDTSSGECGLLQAPGIAPARLAVLLNAPPLAAHAMQGHQAELLQSLGSIPPPPVLQALRSLQGIVPQARLRLAPAPLDQAPRQGLLHATLRFDYAGHLGWWDGAGDTVVLESSQERLLLHRDVASERRAVLRLTGLGLSTFGGGVFGIPADRSQQDWLRWADEDFAVLREAGFDLTLDEALIGWITRADALHVRMRAEHDDGGDGDGDGGDGGGDQGATSPWFDLSLGIEIDGQRHNILPLLPDLIAQAAASTADPASGLPELPPFIYLRGPDGTGYLRLPTDSLRPWMAALLELVGDRHRDFTGDSLRLSHLDALRTGAALGAGAVWEGANALRTMVQQLRGAAGLPEVPVPESVQATLRPYQQQGLGWLQFLRTHGLAGILADDMGLGKTLQTLVHIQVEKDAGRLTRPALIIAPVSLMGNWQREAARFCPQLRSLVIHGKDRHGVTSSIDQQDLVIAPYSLLQRDRERWLQAPWHLVVLDEAQNIKNASTHAAQVVGELQTRHRLCLSGTPMENHLGEIWSLFHFLMPGFLGSQKRFGELFRAPIEKLGNPERLAQLRARVTPFMLRRTKDLVATELPPKVETIMRVELSGAQADLYETIRLGMEKAVREALGAKGLAKSQITILDALLKLRQVCCDPRLLPLAAAKKLKVSAKVEQLMEMLPEMLAEGRRILLFSQFTSMLSLIEVELEKRKIRWIKLTGQSQNRDALIEQFTSGKAPLFLISLKAGGVGLNLPQADTVIHYDPWWNPAVENQATDRAHRIGQTRSVWVVKLVAQGTIEERILALQERKAALAESMYSGAAGRKQPLFTESDLAELLRPLSAA
jgi:superfamily II DNA or RNA helicase